MSPLQDSHATPPLLHRDIRWPNVIQRMDDPQQWFLIDWEDASGTPTEALPQFSRGTHSPGVFLPGHGFEVDMWGVGHLIATSTAMNISSQLRRLGIRMQMTPTLRAVQALTMLKQLQLTLS